MSTEYTSAQIEAFSEAAKRYNREASLTALLTFVVCLLAFPVLLWVAFAFVEVEKEYRLYAAISLGVAFITSAVAYWGHLLFWRIDWIMGQLWAVGQQVHDTQQNLKELD